MVSIEHQQYLENSDTEELKLDEETNDVESIDNTKDYTVLNPYTREDEAEDEGSEIEDVDLETAEILTIMNRVPDDMKWLNDKSKTVKQKEKEMDEFEIEFWKRNTIEALSLPDDGNKDECPHTSRLNKASCWNYLENRDSNGKPIGSRQTDVFVKFSDFEKEPRYEKDPRYKRMMVLYEQRKVDLEKAREAWKKLHPKTFKKTALITIQKRELTNKLRKERKAAKEKGKDVKKKGKKVVAESSSEDESDKDDKKSKGKKKKAVAESDSDTNAKKSKGVKKAKKVVAESSSEDESEEEEVKIPKRKKQSAASPRNTEYKRIKIEDIAKLDDSVLGTLSVRETYQFGENQIVGKSLAGHFMRETELRFQLYEDMDEIVTKSVKDSIKDANERGEATKKLIQKKWKEAAFRSDEANARLLDRFSQKTVLQLQEDTLQLEDK